MRYQPFAALLLLIAVGCTSKDAINLSVKNDTEWPLTLRLTKDVPQSSYFWTSPEDQVEARVIVMPGNEPGGWIDDLPKSRTATQNDISGGFKNGTHAMLRIYRGNRLTLRDLVQMTVGPDRVDVPLHIGDNELVIHDNGSKLSVEEIPHPVTK